MKTVILVSVTDFISIINYKHLVTNVSAFFLLHDFAANYEEEPWEYKVEHSFTEGADKTEDESEIIYGDGKKNDKAHIDYTYGVVWSFVAIIYNIINGHVTRTCTSIILFIFISVSNVINMLFAASIVFLLL